MGCFFFSTVNPHKFMIILTELGFSEIFFILYAKYYKCVGLAYITFETKKKNKKNVFYE